MVDERDILKQYSYKATSNLVIEQGRRRRPAADSNATSLRANALPGRMGDKAHVTKPPPSADSIRNQPAADFAFQPANARKTTIIDAAEELDVADISEPYVPTTQVSKRAYEALLALISSKLGDQPRELLRGATEEVIAIMKNDQQQTEEKRKELSNILATSISSDEFAKILLFTGKMSDFEIDDGTRPTENGLTVLLDEEEADENGVLPSRENQNENALLLAELNKVAEGNELDENLNIDESTLSPQVPTINSISSASSSSRVRLELSKVLRLSFSKTQAESIIPIVLDALQNSADDRTCENKLATILGYENIELVAQMMNLRVSAITAAESAAAERPAKDENGALLSGKLEPVAEDHFGDETKSHPKPLSRVTRKRPRVSSSPEMGLQTADHRAHAMDESDQWELDIDTLATRESRGLHAVENADLPEGSQHIAGKDYEEWFIPPVMQGVEKRNAALVSVQELPPWARAAFPGTTNFNRMQSATYSCAFQSQENMLVCAPTGAGKTNVAMLCAVRALRDALQNSDTQHHGPVANVVVYVAPMKALVAEVVNNFGKRLNPLGIRVRELTGDVNLTNQELRSSHVIVTTPEKWDIVSRRGGGNRLASLVDLLIIDEIHLLNDDRGPVLESIVARARRSCLSTNDTIRIVGLSATLPNYDDVAAFISVHKGKGLFVFDETYRPCPLQQCFMGISAKKAVKRFQMQNSLAYERTMFQMKNSEQGIIFVHSRKETLSTCKYMIERSIEEEVTDGFLKPGSAAFEIIQAELSNVKSKDLRDVLEYGLAIHHAGMLRSDRELVEALFEKGHIRALVSTATLAWGVNLPAHAVIIKGTQVYSPKHGHWVDLSPMDVMQMMGRAGRPQFDTYGEGIIITAKADVMYYLSVLTNNMPVESQLISRLVDLLNAEVASRTVSSIEDGAEWLSCTYLQVRMLKNPNLYGISTQQLAADPTLTNRRRRLVHSAACRLHRLGLVEYAFESGELNATPLGRLAADFYVSHKTMSTYVAGLRANITDIDLLRLLSLSGEFAQIRVRDEEVLELSRLAERTPIPVKESLEEPSSKANILLQSYISQLPMDGLALRADMIHISQNAARLTRALVLTAVALKQPRAFLTCLRLYKSVTKRQWSTQTPLRQFRMRIPPDIIRRIERKDIPFERYYDLEVAALQELAKDKDAGRQLYRYIHYLPRMQLDVSARPVSRSSLEVTVKLVPDFRFDKDVHGGAEVFWIFVEDGDSDHMLYAKMHHVRPFGQQNYSIVLKVPLTSPAPHHYFVRCLSDSWLAPETAVPILLNDILLPEKFEAFSKLPTDALVSVSKAFSTFDIATEEGLLDPDATRELLANVSAHYQACFKRFPAMASHLFPSLLQSVENLVLAAPPTQDRDICGEMSVAGLFSRKPTACAVWIVAREDRALDHTYRRLARGIGHALSLHVVKLDGLENPDSHEIQRAGTLMVTGIAQWDQFSRKWRQKREGKILGKVELVILDGIHAMSSPREEAPALEAMASRLRYIAETNSSETKTRIVALSDPIANATSVAHWLGAESSSIFSYTWENDRRHFSLEVISTLRSWVDYEAPAIVRSLHGVLKKKAWRGEQPVLVFFPSEEVARLCANELSSKEGLFSSLTLERHSDSTKPSTPLATPGRRLSSTMRVACATKNMSRAAIEDAEKSFADHSCDLLIATPEFAWETDLTSSIVVIYGTKTDSDSLDSQISGELDRSDIVRMISKVRRTGEGREGHCAVLVVQEGAHDEYTCILDPLPLESQLPERFADHLNAEISSGVIETKQDAVDYLTWTFFYHRLPKNPSYYGLRGLQPEEISIHLSELVEMSLSDLEGSKCVAVEGEQDVELGALNLGKIASYHYVRHETVEFFAASVNPRVKLRSILDILSFAWEFRTIGVRLSDIRALRELADVVPFAVDPEEGDVAHNISSRHKVHLLLQAHMSRVDLDVDMQTEQAVIVKTSLRLLRAFVDVVASAGWLKPALVASELSQMLVQGLWELDIPLLQLPHISAGAAKLLKDKYDVTDVFEFSNMEHGQRVEALSGLTKAQFMELAGACAAYPNLDDLTAKRERKSRADGSSTTRVMVTITRAAEDADDNEANDAGFRIPRVTAGRYPGPKLEGWWLFLGIPSQNKLLTLKYFHLRSTATVKLNYDDSGVDSEQETVLYLVPDAYVDCNQEEAISELL